MSAADAPDWQRVVQTVQSTGAVPDAPDWERIAVGPGGTPIGPTPGGSTSSPYYVAGFSALTCDPLAAPNTPTHAAGVISLTCFTAARTFTCRYVTFAVSGAAVTPNENYIGVYAIGTPLVSTAMTLVGATGSGACDGPFEGTNVQKVFFATSFTLQANTLYACAILNNGGTPKFDQGLAASLPAANPFGSSWPMLSVTNASYTSLPASINYADVTEDQAFWLMYFSEQ